MILLTLCLSLALGQTLSGGSGVDLPCGFDAMRDEMYPGWSAGTGQLTYPVKHGVVVSPQCAAYGLKSNSDVQGLECVNGRFLVVLNDAKHVDIESVDVCEDNAKFTGEEEISDDDEFDLGGVTVEHVSAEMLEKLFEAESKKTGVHCDDKETHEDCKDSSGCFWDYQDDRCQTTAVLIEKPIECYPDQMDAFINCLIAQNCDEQLKKASTCFKNVFHFWEHKRLNDAFAKADLEHSGHLGFPYEVDLFCEELGIECPQFEKALESLNKRVTKKFLYRYLGHLSTELDDTVWKMERRIHGDEEEHLFDKKPENFEKWDAYQGPLMKAKFGETCGRWVSDGSVVQRICGPALVCDPRWKFCGDNPTSYVGDETRDLLQDLEFHHVYSDGGLILYEAGLKPSLDHLLNAVLPGRRQLFAGAIEALGNLLQENLPSEHAVMCGGCKVMVEALLVAGVGVGCASAASAGCAAVALPSAELMYPACVAAVGAACSGIVLKIHNYLTTNGQWYCSKVGLCPQPAGTRSLIKNGCIQSEQCDGHYWHVKHGSDTNGNPVHMWQGCGNRNSKWVFEDQQLKKEANKGRCLHKRDGNNHNGNIIHEWDCNGNMNSRFKYDPSSRKLYTADDTRFTLHKKWGSCSNGNIIHQWGDSGGSGNYNELWGTA